MPTIHMKMEQEVESEFEGLAHFETPKKISLLEHEFTIERGELTPSLKSETQSDRPSVQGRDPTKCTKSPSAQAPARRSATGAVTSSRSPTHSRSFARHLAHVTRRRDRQRSHHTPSRRRVLARPT